MGAEVASLRQMICDLVYVPLHEFQLLNDDVSPVLGEEECRPDSEGGLEQSTCLLTEHHVTAFAGYVTGHSDWPAGILCQNASNRSP